MDVTDLEGLRATLEQTRPVVAIVMIDNYEDLMSACPEGKRSAVRAAIEEKMDQWRGDAGTLLMKPIEKLTEEEADRLALMFEIAPRLADAYRQFNKIRKPS